MGHLVAQMLTEANSIGVHADFNEEEIDTTEEVAQGLICDQFLEDGKKK